MNDFLRSQVATYTIKVVIFGSRLKIEILLLQTTNRKYCMIYRIAQFPMTLSDVQSRLPIASF